MLKPWHIIYAYPLRLYNVIADKFCWVTTCITRGKDGKREILLLWSQATNDILTGQALLGIRWNRQSSLDTSATSLMAYPSGIMHWTLTLASGDRILVLNIQRGIRKPSSTLISFWPLSYTCILHDALPQNARVLDSGTACELDFRLCMVIIRPVLIHNCIYRHV